MKTRLIFFLFALGFALYSCKDSEDSFSLKVSQSSFNDISSDGATLTVDITCDDAWTVHSNVESWCTVTPQAGTGDKTLTIQVVGNLDQTARTVTITVTSNRISKEIKVSQNAASASSDLNTYHYKLPVIFHVIYQDKNNKNQYVEAGRLPEILEKVNQLYQHAGANSADMNLEFVLATQDPTGKVLAEPGVERIQWNTSTFDIEDFMFSNNQTYNHFIWEPNDYINVMIYTFTDEDAMGVSHFPYTPKKHPLEGTETVSYRLTGKNLKYAYCLSLNNTYIYEESSAGMLNQSDAAITLAHELGHYLGLYHVFSEATQNGVDICEDTDYCDDTQTYDRKGYENWLNNLPLLPSGQKYTLNDLCQRRNCQGTSSFTSHNIMDYAVSYLNQFTQGQKTRVRHILTYSSLIPGPKKEQTSTRAVYDGVLDLPIRVMK